MKFIVNGGKQLSGEIDVRGSKNAATPILAATLLTDRTCVIKNLPLIGDVLIVINILEELGADIEWIDERSIRIKNNEFDPFDLPRDLVRKIRSSILLIGPILARYGKIKLNTPGGCHIGVRPMDAHFDAFKDLGFNVDYDEKEDLYTVQKGGESLKKITLKEFSVTATENLLMYGAMNPGLQIEIAATEPHVVDLGKFISKLGAEIEGLGTHDIKVNKGIDAGGGDVEHNITSDYIEAGTYIVLAAATKSNLRIKNVPVGDLVIPLLKLRESNLIYEIDGKDVIVKGAESELVSPGKIMTQPHPGFPSDLQAPFGVLATQARGTTKIFDTLYEGRLKYLYELDKMGAAVEILGPHRAIIKGPKHLHGKNVESLDLRAGATLIIAALVAEGESTLHGVEQIDRGYEKIEERLSAIGADIKRI